MDNEIEKRELQFEEIRGIITWHRAKALQGVNEESLMMSWRVGHMVMFYEAYSSEAFRTKTDSLKLPTIVQTDSAQLAN